MFSANRQSNHFDDSKVVFRLSLPSNIHETAQTFDRAENIVSSERMALNERGLNPTMTGMTNKKTPTTTSATANKIAPYHPKTTQSNTDNKESRFSQIEDSNRSDKHAAAAYLQVMSPVVATT